MYNLGTNLNDPFTEITESNEGSDIMSALWYWPLLHSTDFA
jgi:hypothetical protein